MVTQVTDLFTRINAFEAQLSALHLARPSGVPAHLTDVELAARRLKGLSRDIPSLLKVVQLYDFYTGKQVWPVPRDWSVFVPQMYADARAGPDWWKLREQDAAYAKAESQRVNDYYAEQARLREERER
jgi:hypothetical protein